MAAQHHRAAAPRILVTTWRQDVAGLLGSPATYTLNADYVEAIGRAGGVALLVPHVTAADARTLLAEADGLLLSGGPDVDPRAYGEEDEGACWGVDPLADRSEFALAREAVRIGLPTLAICRGLQVLNVALRGSLHQHISGADGHPPLEGPPDGLRAARHEVQLTPGSHLAAVYGVERRMVNTIHHQAVKRVGDGLRVTARDENGIVEGLEMEDGRPIIAVQWHPERHEGEDRLFEHFIAQARHAGDASGTQVAA